MPFLRNAWYVAAWGSEVKDAPFHRTILNEPVLMYRKQTGEAIAIADRCAHRFAPLHRGSWFAMRSSVGTMDSAMTAPAFAFTAPMVTAPFPKLHD